MVAAPSLNVLSVKKSSFCPPQDQAVVPTYEQNTQQPSPSFSSRSNQMPLPPSKFSTSNSQIRPQQQPTPPPSDGPLIEEPLSEAPAQTTSTAQDAKSSLTNENDFEDVIPSLKPSRYAPIRSTFKSHPVDFEYDNGWWQTRFAELYTEIADFAQTFYGRHEVSHEAPSMWKTANVSVLFAEWCDHVATANDENGGWVPLLQDTVQRVKLIEAILTRVVFTRIFEHELFGCTQRDKVLLKQLDHGILEAEPFTRTSLRAHTVRAILEGCPVPTYFHLSCSTLAYKLVLLLEPVTDYFYLRQEQPRPCLPAMTNHHQSLYDIVSHAGYLAVCARASTSIIYHCFAVAGDNFDAQQNQWDMLQDFIKANRRSADVEIQMKKIKISVWPSVQRLSPGSGSNDQDNDNGMRIWLCCAAGTICFYGRQVQGERCLTWLTRILEADKILGYSLACCSVVCIVGIWSGQIQPQECLISIWRLLTWA